MIDTDREAKLHRLQNAGIPLKYRSLTKKDFERKGAILFDYLGSPAYAEDLAEGKGICLSGNPAVRSDLLAMMAKGSALAGRSTVLVSLHQLVPLIANNEERRNFITRADFVYVDWFEREFRDNACPYTFSELCDVEDFIVGRSHGNRATNFASCKRWEQLSWFSRDFLGAMSDHVIDIVL